MKRTILILTALVAVNVASAQFFVKAGLGYNLSAVTQARGLSTLDSSGNNFTTSSRHSFGNGVNVLGAVGYDFTENLGFQLGVGYLLSSSPLELEVNATSTTNVPVLYSSSSKSNGFMTLMPAFTMSSNGDKFNMYSRVGLTIPVAGKIETEVSYVGTGINQENAFESKGKFSLGYNAALGLSLPLGDKLSFWGELTGNFINVAADTRTMTKYMSNGNDILAARTKRETEVIYVDKIDASTSTASTDPLSLIAEDSPFSSIGLAAGIKFSFGNSRADRRNSGE